MIEVRFGAPLQLLKLIGNLVESGFDAGLVLFAARSARRTGPANRVVTDFDRQRPLIGDDVIEMNQGERGVGLQTRHDFARGNAERARGVMLFSMVCGPVLSPRT